MQSASRMKTASQRTIVAEPGLRMAWLVPALGSGHRGLRWKRRASPTAAVRPTSLGLGSNQERVGSPDADGRPAEAGLPGRRAEGGPPVEACGRRTGNGATGRDGGCPDGAVRTCSWGADGGERRGSGDAAGRPPAETGGRVWLRAAGHRRRCGGGGPGRLRGPGFRLLRMDLQGWLLRMGLRGWLLRMGLRGWLLRMGLRGWLWWTGLRGRGLLRRQVGWGNGRRRWCGGPGLGRCQARVGLRPGRHLGNSGGQLCCCPLRSGRELWLRRVTGLRPGAARRCLLVRARSLRRPSRGRGTVGRWAVGDPSDRGCLVEERRGGCGWGSRHGRGGRRGGDPPDGCRLVGDGLAVKRLAGWVTGLAAPLAGRGGGPGGY